MTRKPKTPPGPRPKKVIQAFVDAATEGILKHELESALCTSRRAKSKKEKLNPTPKQKRLLRWIWMRRITFAESLGMNWTFLGGLMTRGLVSLQRDPKTGELLLHVEDELVVEPILRVVHGGRV